MHRHELIADRVRIAVGPAAVLRLESELGFQLQLPAAAAGKLPLGHVRRVLHPLRSYRAPPECLLWQQRQSAPD